MSKYTREDLRDKALQFLRYYDQCDTRCGILLAFLMQRTGCNEAQCMQSIRALAS